MSTKTIPSRILARGSTYRAVLAPIAFGVIFVGLWQFLVTALEVEPYVVPSPAAILTEFWANLGNVVSGALRTGANALIGLVFGTVIGVLAAIVANVVQVVDSRGRPGGGGVVGDAHRGAGPGALHDVRRGRRHRPAAGGRSRRPGPGVPQHAARAASGAPGASGPDARVRGLAPASNSSP